MMTKIQLSKIDQLIQGLQVLPYLRWIGVGGLFVLAFWIRLYRMNEPPLDFHAVRQYHSLLIARDFFYERSNVIPEWKRHIASLNKQRQGMWEPPIMEGLTATGYRIARGEYFWVPRLLASIFWLLGGLFLFLIAQRITDPHSGSALISTAFYLFHPFNVTASRSFQPESLMIMGLIISIYAILMYYDKPSTLRLMIAAGVSALAILVKGVTLFPILVSYIFLSIYLPCHRKKAFRGPSFIFLVVALLPTLLFYSYGIFISKSLLGVAKGNILPHLLLSPSFWKGWVEQIGNVIGYTALVGALLGTLLLRQGLPRGLLLGWWAGYFIFGLVFSYTVHTHDYWNLQIVPIAALVVGPLVALIINHVRRMNPHWYWQGVLASILIFATLLLLILARPKALPPALGRKVMVAQEVGDLVNHSTQTVFLSPDYGLPLEYHGELSGVPWPIASDLEWEKLSGTRTPEAEERFLALFQNDPPEYFIVLDKIEFEAQPDLRDFLTHNYPVFAQSEDYLIFDLSGQAGDE